MAYPILEENNFDIFINEENQDILNNSNNNFNSIFLNN